MAASRHGIAMVVVIVGCVGKMANIHIRRVEVSRSCCVFNDSDDSITSSISSLVNATSCIHTGYPLLICMVSRREVESLSSLDDKVKRHGISGIMAYASWSISSSAIHSLHDVII